MKILNLLSSLILPIKIIKEKNKGSKKENYWKQWKRFEKQLFGNGKCFFWTDEWTKIFNGKLIKLQKHFGTKTVTKSLKKR